MTPRDPRSVRRTAVRRTAVLGAALAAGALVAGLSTTAQEPEGDEPVVERQVHRVVVAPPGGEGEGKKVRVILRKGDGEPEVRELVVPSGSHFEALGQRLGEGFGRHVAAPMVWFGDGPRGFLGVELTMLTPELRSHFGASEEAGVLVGRVEPESPADRAGVRVGDVITHVDGEPVGSTFDVVRAVGGKKAGEIVAIELVRDGRVETLSAAVAEREVPRIDVGPLVRRFAVEGDEEFEVDLEALTENMERLDEYFAGPEWKAQVERLEGLGTELEKRLEGLEVELELLERELERNEEVLEENEEELERNEEVLEGVGPSGAV